MPRLAHIPVKGVELNGETKNSHRSQLQQLSKCMADFYVKDGGVRTITVIRDKREREREGGAACRVIL